MKKKFYKINLNDYIYVSLDNKGKQIIIDYWNEVPGINFTWEDLNRKYRSRLKGSNGEYFYQLQMHELISIFNNKYIVGCYAPFSMEAYLGKKPKIKELEVDDQ